MVPPATIFIAAGTSVAGFTPYSISQIGRSVGALRRGLLSRVLAGFVLTV